MAELDVRYILEMQVDGKVWKAYVLPRVFDVTFGLVPPDSRRFGLEGRPRKQHAPYRDIPISIRGRSGHKNESGRAPGGAHTGNGPDYFRELVKFLNDFQRYAAQHESAFAQDKTVQLVFRALWENEHHLVHLVRFDQHRDTDTARFSYTWSAEFKTDGPAGRSTVYDVLTRGDAAAAKRLAAVVARTGERDAAAARMAAGASMADALRRAHERRTVSSVDAFADKVEAFVEEASAYVAEVGAAMEPARKPLEAALRAATAVRGFAQGLREVTLEFPRSLVLDLFNALDAAASAVFETWDALPRAARVTSRANMVAGLTAVQSLRTSTLEWLGRRGERVGALGDRVSFLGGGPGVAVYQGAIVAEHVLTLGQSLQDVAFERLGERGRWTEIAALNGMPNDRELRDGSPLVPGVALKVPAVDGEGVAVRHVGDEELFGVDFAVGADRDLVAVGNPPVDVATVSGEALLEQAVWLRASMLKGQNTVWPEAGIDRVVAAPMDRASLSYFAAHTREQFLRDDRVAAVEDFRLEADGTLVSATFAVVPVTGGKVPMKVPMA